jgi:hypothetical protein
VEVSEVGAGEVIVEFEEWDGNLLQWTITDRQTIEPTTVFDEPIPVEARSYEGYEFIGWSSECTDENLPLNKKQITVHSFKTNCLTAHFARETEPVPSPDPDPDPAPEPPAGSEEFDTVERAFCRCTLETIRKYIEIPDGKEMKALRYITWLINNVQIEWEEVCECG